MNIYLLILLSVLMVAIAIVLYGWFVRGIFTFVRSLNFWRKMYGEGGYATEYFRQSQYWKIEAVNEGAIIGWYGPYFFKSYSFTFYVYCKTDDVYKYWSDFLNFKRNK